MRKMKFVALVSGGKDSLFALYKTSKSMECIGLISICGERESKLLHTQNIELVKHVSDAIGIPLLYFTAKDAKGELDALSHALAKAKEMGADAVVSGALASNYQKKIIDSVATSYNLKHIAPLWHCDLEAYLKELIKEGFEVIFTVVAAEGFDERWLGRRLDENALEELKVLNKKYGIHIGGEGGEYESLVLDCPLYKYKIKICESTTHWDGTSGWLEIKKVKLERKDS